MVNKHFERKVKISLVLKGELAERFDKYLEGGLFANKPEIIRADLRQFFYDLDEKELQHSRMNAIRSR